MAAARGDLPGLPAALPPDPDDDDGGAARRAAADARHRHRLGAAPAARRHDRRRADRQPGADAVHHAGDLSVLRPAGACGCRRAAGERRQRQRRARRRHEHLRAVHRASGRHHAADHRHRAGRRCSPIFELPVSPLPQVDFPTISVQAQLPGASPDTVATSVAAPLERQLGADRRRHRDDLDQLGRRRRASRCSSTSTATSTAPRATCRRRSTPRAPTCRPTCAATRPTARSIPADAPILILALTSKTLTRGQMYDAASNVLAAAAVADRGIGQVIIGGGALPAVRVELNPHALFKYGIGLEDVRAALASANANSAEGRDRGRRPAFADLHQRPVDDGRRLQAAGDRLPQRRSRCG